MSGLPESPPVLIVHLEYGQVNEDGKMPSGAFVQVDGMYLTGTLRDDASSGCGPDEGHWVVVLFPRNTSGTVTGWFMLSANRSALAESFVDTLSGMLIQAMPRLH
jgi:hypothetical protein